MNILDSFAALSNFANRLNTRGETRLSNLDQAGVMGVQVEPSQSDSLIQSQRDDQLCPPTTLAGRNSIYQLNSDPGAISLVLENLDNNFNSVVSQFPSSTVTSNREELAGFIVDVVTSNQRY